jgi:hypothetical protein
MHNIPKEQVPHASIYFSRSVPGHGQMYAVMAQEKSQETVKVNAQDIYEQRISLKSHIYIHEMSFNYLPLAGLGYEGPIQNITDVILNISIATANKIYHTTF